MRLLVRERRVNHVSGYGSSIGGHVESREAVPGPSGRKRRTEALARKIRDDGSETPAPRCSQTAGGPVDIAIEVKCGSNRCAHMANVMSRCHDVNRRQAMSKVEALATRRLGPNLNQ